MNLTPEQLAALRVRMAEADGWYPIEDEYGWPPNADRSLQSEGMSKLLDYPNDLNAFHRLEEKLTPEQRDRFREELSWLCESEWKADRFPMRNPIHAPADLKCIALDRTLNPTNPIV